MRIAVKPLFVSVLLLMFAVPSLTAQTAAKNPFPQQKGYVNDFAGVLSEVGAENLETVLARYHKDTGIQLLLLIMEPTPDVRACEGLPRCDYGEDIIAQWGIGKKKGDHGGAVLMLFPGTEYVLVPTTISIDKMFRDAKDEKFYPEMAYAVIEEKNWQNASMRGISSLMNIFDPPGKRQPRPQQQARR